jgi:hypothetical protein
LELLEELVRFYADRRYRPDGAPLVESLYCMNGYTFEAFDAVPYLDYSSATPGCGKTVTQSAMSRCAVALNCPALQRLPK